MGKKLQHSFISALTVSILSSIFPSETIATTYLDEWQEDNNNSIFSSSSGKAYYPTIIKESASSYKMWYTGSGGIFYATSSDGTSWADGNGGSALTGLTNPHHVVVRYDGGKYKIWYWDYSQLYSINSIRYAESSDGITWTNDQAVTQNASKPIITGTSGDWNRGSYGPSDVILNPSASNSGSNPWNYSYVMYYDATTGGNQDIGLAYSSNGLSWSRYGSSNSEGLVLEHSGTEWDATHVGRSSIYKDADGDFHMWYSGGDGRVDNGIGYATSSNGIDWVRYPQSGSNTIFSVDDNVAWRTSRTYTPVVIDGEEMWFTGDDGSNRTIGYATTVPEPLALGLVTSTAILFLGLRRFMLTRGI